LASIVRVMRLRRLATASLLGALLLSAGCGGGDGETAGEFTGISLEVQEPGPVHIHGLGYDRVGRVLYIATHTGMFELADGAARAVRIGDSRQDTMGFSLVRPGLFLGSGHPDARANVPPHLGLIASTDRGRSWRPVSLTGEADFHVLRARGNNVYGYDVTNQRLLASNDAGRTWTKLSAPEEVRDLAIDPSDPDHLLASGGSVLYRSLDRGRSWRVSTSAAGYLAWPVRDRLYLATPDGAFLTATAPAGPWRAQAALDAPVAALHAVDDKVLFAAVHDGTIKQSTDGGATWKVRATP
jgi:hypothetical protein